MKILEAEFVQGFIRMTDDGYNQGWHERNGGNLTYRIKKKKWNLLGKNLRRMQNGNQLRLKLKISR